MNKALFLDRDGIINYTVSDGRTSRPPKHIKEVRIMYGIETVLIYAIQEGFFPIVVTNQPDVARGNQKIEVIEEINTYIKGKLPIIDFFTCIHDNQDNCVCRKPKSGLLHFAAQRYNIELWKSFMVGDRNQDILAGNNAGCKTIYVNDEGIKNNLATFSISSVYNIIDIIGSKNV